MDVFAVDGVDDRFTADPAAFVTERDALAKRLKAEGKKDEAAAVKALRKPSVIAAALNAVARLSGLSQRSGAVATVRRNKAGGPS